VVGETSSNIGSYDGMMTLLSSISNGGSGPVPMSRPTDAMGAALRHAFSRSAMPDDLAALLHRLEQVPAHRN
jgi:hypothetical protein